jgi:hypothetical protein
MNYYLYNQQFLQQLAHQYQSFPLEYLLRRFGKNLYNMIFWTMDMTSDPQELADAFSTSDMTYGDWVWLILFLEDHYEEEAVVLCVQAGQISFAN